MLGSWTLTSRVRRRVLTKKIVREFFNYDPVTGSLMWRFRERKWFKTEGSFKSWNTRYVGKDFGSKCPRGYIIGAVLYVTYSAPEIIFIWMTGKLPKEIDHFNQNKSDNSWENLKDTTRSGNCKNYPKRKDNTTGYTGIYKTKSGFYAEISSEGQTYYLGHRSSLNEVIQIRKEAEQKYGFSERHGK